MLFVCCPAGSPRSLLGEPNTVCGSADPLLQAPLLSVLNLRTFFLAAQGANFEALIRLSLHLKLQPIEFNVVANGLSIEIRLGLPRSSSDHPQVCTSSLVSLQGLSFLTY